MFHLLRKVELKLYIIYNVFTQMTYMVVHVHIVHVYVFIIL